MSTTPAPSNPKQLSYAQIFADYLATRQRKHDDADLDQALARLNQRLEHAEKFLTSLPGRVHVHVEIDKERGVALYRDGDTWALGLDPQLASESVPIKRWHKCSIEEKAALAGGLDSLLQRLLALTDERQKLVENAHLALDGFDVRVRGLTEDR